MVSSTNNDILQRLKSGLRLSSVVPATMTCQEHKTHELTNMDLAMKLHYLKGVYFFSSDAVEGFTIHDLKKPMFHLLRLYFTASGRIRRSETGRPFIRCNDSGVRTVEGYFDETIDECLAMAMEDYSSVSEALAYNQALGPDLGFSPLVFIQLTWFKCGGMAVGLSWANVLGDAFSASTFINMWGKIMSGQVPPKSLYVPGNTIKSEFPRSTPKGTSTPNSLKNVDSVGDFWVAPSSCKMKTHTFRVSAEKIDHFLSNQTAKVSPFEVISAVIWKSLSKIKENPEQTKMVTFCTRKNSHERGLEVPSNRMVLSTVEADSCVAEAEVPELVELILKNRADESGMIESDNEGDGFSDCIAYGARLTFVNLEEADIYELELKGKKPLYANYSISGVGGEGAVLVLPAEPKHGKEEDENGDLSVTVILPENELAQLKSELKRDWSIA